MIFKVGFLTFALAVSEFNVGNLDFTLKFFRNHYNSSSNSIVSPISVRLALAALYQAAGPKLDPTFQHAISIPTKNKKKIANDIRAFLETTNSEHLRVLFKAYKLDKALDATFEKALQDVFGTSIDTVDFRNRAKVTNVVNRWVSDATNQLIEKFVEESSVDPSTEFMLINAVALEARWANKFSPNQTRQMTFHFENGDREVQMMSQVMSVSYKIAEDFHAAELLYTEKSDLSMWIILPRGRGSLGDLVGSLTPELLTNIRLGAKTVSLNVELPRFTIRNEFDVNRVLEKMGHGGLFGNADLQVFAGSKSEIDDIFQSAVIKVNEEGTEASSGTRVNVKWRVGPRPFFANKPFIFFIQKRSTNTILFIGQYSNHED
ncbi:hypothetical protein pipiens_005557 [Culex pipiens pipiens]|uniref:Serpin domain-containing protein n=1 Tax=Culex pipiens pipiens TaxID=38569 RepID=A0ABD1DWD0_CULPP